MLFALDMMHHDVFLKHTISLDAKRVDVKEIDVSIQFTNGQKFEFRDHMLQWIHTDVFKLGFYVVMDNPIMVQIEELYF